jgi:hypothetical protein
MKKDNGSSEEDKEVKHAHASGNGLGGFRGGSSAWYYLYGGHPLSGPIADAQKLGKPPTTQDTLSKVNPSQLRTGHLPDHFELLTASGLLKAWGSLSFGVKPKEAQELSLGQTTSDATILQPKSPGRIESLRDLH